MAIPLKYNTASQEIPLGHFLDSTDGDTEEPGLTIANTDIKLWKSGATTLASKNSGGGTYISNGVYYATLDATDTNTYGPMVIFVHVSGALAVRLECLVMEANAYDALMAALGTGYLESNLVSVAGDTTAPGNIANQYDGTTGLTGDPFPSTQAQVGNIGSATGGGLVFEMSADNTGGAIKGASFVGVETTGTYVSTEAEDAVYHNITHSGNAIDIVYQASVGGARRVFEYTFKGYLSSANDTITIQMYDYVGTDWETRGTITGQGGTSNITQSIKALSKHTGTSGSDIGISLIRFVCTGMTSPNFFTDELVASAASVSQSVGYANGAVWLDTTHGTAGTESYVNGVADNPVLGIADANTIAGNLSIHRFEVTPDSTVTLTASQASDVFNGKGYTFELESQVLTGAHIIGAGSVTGIATTGGEEIHFTDCEMGTCTLGASHLTHCGLSGTITLTDTVNYTLVDCYSQVPGSGTPVIDFGAVIGNTGLNLRDYSGGMEVQNMGQAGTDTMSMEGDGQLIINANCTGGTIAIRGHFAITDNSSGAVTITYDDVVTDVVAILEDTADMQPKLGAPAGADMSADIADVKVDTVATLVDTNELQGDWTDGGRLDLLLDALITEIDTPTGEPGQEAPGVSIKRGKKIDYLYKVLRNKSTQTATQQNIYADDGTTVDHKATVSDDGTTYTKGEFGTGA